MNAYLLDKQDKGKIHSFEWISNQEPLSPYDFWLSIDGDSKILIDVKSTPGEFERKIHISLAELELMSSNNEEYQIYRIFDLNEDAKTAKLKIAKDVRDFAKRTLEVFKNLPEGVWVDKISVSPLESGLNFQRATTIKLPKEVTEG